jgi:hypothetical protein
MYNIEKKTESPRGSCDTRAQAMKSYVVEHENHCDYNTTLGNFMRTATKFIMSNAMTTTLATDKNFF